MKRLISTKKIIYEKRPPLSLYMEHYLNTLDENVLEIKTKDITIKIIFLERHIPHLFGLHHFMDKSSSNKTLWYKDRLSGTKGFSNMLEGHITWEDLENANKGRTWSSKNNKKRALSIHLIKDILFKSKLYEINGTVKNSVKGKYLMVCDYDKTTYNIVIEEDLEFNRFGTFYFCLSNLIDDPKAKRIIDDPSTRQIECHSYAYRDFHSNDLLEYRSANFVSDINNDYVVTKQYAYPVISHLISSKRCFYTIYNPINGMYQTSFYSIDKDFTKAVDKFFKKSEKKK